MPAPHSGLCQGAHLWTNKFVAAVRGTALELQPDASCKVMRTPNNYLLNSYSPRFLAWLWSRRPLNYFVK